MVGGDVSQVSQDRGQQERVIKDHTYARHYQRVFPCVEDHIDPVFLPSDITLVVVIKVVQVHQNAYTQSYAGSGGRAGYGPSAASHNAGYGRVSDWTHVKKRVPGNRCCSTVSSSSQT